MVAESLGLVVTANRCSYDVDPTLRLHRFFTSWPKGILAVHIVFLSSEAVPFAKTGGLGDVCGALPAVLAAQGHQVSLIMPGFRSIRKSGVTIEPLDVWMTASMEGRAVSARLCHATIPAAGGQASPVNVYFIDQPSYYDRDGLYGEGGDYQDNCERFAFYNRAALQAISRVCPDVDIVHCNDWQSGLVPAYMAWNFEAHPWMDHARSVMTIHNLAYQGRFWHYDMPLTGLGWDRFDADGVEFYGDLNFLKAGIMLADAITTVSPTYAEEICTPLHGCGLDGVLRSRADCLTGITNGIDDAVWNPSTDPHLVHRYDETSWVSGKTGNKQSLQTEFGLMPNPGLPMIGLVGRLADQKGWDLIIEVMRWNLEENRPVQWMVLGTGEARYHTALQDFATQYPDRFGLRLGFSDALAHRIEAGSDVFLMPSRYEPCGLNQLYSLRYGSVPIVTTTGGLVDTVTNVTAQSLANGSATGFHIEKFTASSIDASLGQALTIRYHQPETWASIVRAGMLTDSSWRQSGMQYEDVYAKTLSLDKNL